MILCGNLLPHLWLNSANNHVASNADQRNIISGEMLHYLMFHPMNQQKDLPSDFYNFSHTLLVLLPSTHTFQVHARLKEHFATCASFVYKQFIFLVYITVHLYTSVSVVISISCVSGHKRLFTAYVLSCHPSHHLCGWHLHYPIPVIEILHTWGRKVHLQLEYVMMFLMDYHSSSHRKPNRHIGCLRPVESCVPIHPLRLYLQRVS
jgi:hypothetical protein